MYILKNGDVVKVEILEHVEKGFKSVKVCYSGKILKVSNCRIYENKEECKIAGKEMKIKRDFKKKHMNKKTGMLKCKGCGCLGKDHTIDHIIPKSEFGGERDVRKNQELWNACWDYSNLQILCSSCNNYKSSFSQESFKREINFISKRGKYLCNKKNKGMSRGYHNQMFKVGYGISTSPHNQKANRYSFKCLEKIAKMDSRILYLSS